MQYNVAINDFELHAEITNEIHYGRLIVGTEVMYEEDGLLDVWERDLHVANVTSEMSDEIIAEIKRAAMDFVCDESEGYSEYALDCRILWDGEKDEVEEGRYGTPHPTHRQLSKERIQYVIEQHKTLCARYMAA